MNINFTFPASGTTLIADQSAVKMKPKDRIVAVFDPTNVLRVTSGDVTFSVLNGETVVFEKTANASMLWNGIDITDVIKKNDLDAFSVQVSVSSTDYATGDFEVQYKFKRTSDGPEVLRLELTIDGSSITGSMTPAEAYEAMVTAPVNVIFEGNSIGTLYEYNIDGTTYVGAGVVLSAQGAFLPGVQGDIVHDGWTGNY